jgi:hypothetical protein
VTIWRIAVALRLSICCQALDRRLRSFLHPNVDFAVPTRRA